jgi:hypothetical protein
LNFFKMSFWLFSLSAILAMVILMPLNYFVSVYPLDDYREWCRLMVATRKYRCSARPTAQLDTWAHGPVRRFVLYDATREPYPLWIHHRPLVGPSNILYDQPDLHISLYRLHPDLPPSEFPPIRPISSIVRFTSHPLGLVPNGPRDRSTQTSTRG